MKNSGIEWIGEIPDDWEVKSIKQLLIERTEKNALYQTDIILSLSAKDGVTLYDGEHHAGNRPREDLSDYKVVYPNDIVVNSMNILSGSVGLSGYKGCVSPVYYIYYPRENDNVEFMHYIFQCKQFQLSLRGLGNGILIKETENGNLNTIRMRIPAQKLGMQQFPWCDSNRQQKIAEFLDKKCAAVDKLISNQQGQIEKLKEYKQATITQAVTKGLNPSAPMKDSGVEWIGNIPEGWTIIKFKYLLDITSGDALTNERLLDSGEYPVYGGGNLIGYSPNYNFENGIIIGRVGARCGCVMLIDDKAWATDNALIVESKINKKYLFYLLVNANLNALNTSNAQPLITSSKIKNIMTLFTKNDVEQQQIAEYLDKKCSEIDKLISIKQAKIEKLNEYKKSLIYEYVTGKKEVV